MRAEMPRDTAATQAHLKSQDIAGIPASNDYYCCYQ